MGCFHRKMLTSFFLLVLCGLSLCACDSYREQDGPRVTPDTGRYLKFEADGNLGRVIFPESGNGSSAFEPCFIQYQSGDIDGWYTVDGGMTGETWIVYNFYDSGSGQWSDYKSVIQTEAGYLDSYSISQPSAIKLGDYYYVAYTGSSNNEEGTQGNCAGLFVARAEKAEGPYEKWDGQSWGGTTKPFLYYDGPDTMPGAGDVSLIELDGTLYIYYSWNSADLKGEPVSEIRLAKANASDENWPGTLQTYGSVCRGKGQISGLEVKYSEETGKMFGIGIENRGSSDCAIVCFEGNSPEKLSRVSAVRSGIYDSITSIGISGSVNGHIRRRTNLSPFILYSYYAEGTQGYQPKLQWSDITLFLSDRTDISSKPGYFTEPAEKEEQAGEADPQQKDSVLAVYADIGFQDCVLGDRKTVSLSVMNQAGETEALSEEQWERVVFSDYDENVIQFDGMTLIPQESGLTRVKVSLDGAYSYFTVAVYESLEEEKEIPLSLESFSPTVRLSLSDRCAVQLRAFTRNSGGTYGELYSGITYSGYDREVLEINNAGVIVPVKEGKTEVTLTYRKLSCQITVIITP